MDAVDRDQRFDLRRILPARCWRAHRRQVHRRGNTGVVLSRMRDGRNGTDAISRAAARGTRKRIHVAFGRAAAGGRAEDASRRISARGTARRETSPLREREVAKPRVGERRALEFGNVRRPSPGRRSSELGDRRGQLALAKPSSFTPARFVPAVALGVEWERRDETFGTP